MTEAEKKELLSLLPSPDVPRAFLYGLLAMGGAGAFMFLYAFAEVLPWHS